MFDQLTSAISRIVEDFGPKQRMTEKSIQPALREVRRALLDADVNLEVADTLIDGVKKRSLGDEVLKGVTADQQFKKAIYDELLDIMGGGGNDADALPTALPGGVMAAPAATLAVGIAGDPAVVLLAGLQGAGKTTAAGKLALYLKEREVDYTASPIDGNDNPDEPVLASQLPKRNRKVLLAAADVYRPAAIRQLEILGESIGVDVFSMGTEANPVDIASSALQKAKDEGYDTVVVDTAGRQVIDADLMDELQRIKKAVEPDETLLVVDAMTGQEAASLTAAFDSAVGLTGAILTKMDGDSRGGAAVSVRGVSGKPIKFVGTGEKTSDLEPFYPDRMASRILGMGDVISIVEKAAAEVSAEESRRLTEKVMKAEFDFDDFLQQAKLVAKMGSLGSLAKMMPGMGGIGNDQLQAAEARLKKNEAMICSMTKKERQNPELLIADSTARSRLQRIAKGSGSTMENTKRFISEFQRMRTMMSRMTKANSQMMGGDPAMAGAGADGGDPMNMNMPPGNRASRRADKKKKKGGRGGGGGFG
jgi:signal recognition particle subunit SRP54